MAENKNKECPACGSSTISEASDGLCFSCQIKGMEAKKFSANSFFFDDEESAVDLAEDIPNRIRAYLKDTIRIDGELGRGAMGIVFSGHQEKLDRPIAVKVLTPHPDLHGILVDRFMIEARTMAKLNHGNIVTIHDFGQTDCKLSYFIMEKVQGTTLKDHLEFNSICMRDLLMIMSQVADAIGHAHGRDVIHRDIKPENILVNRRGHAKVLDFGLAKLEGASHVARLTRTHQMLGTPLYMAPEQAFSAKNVDHRTDLYAVGVILYEILTGTMPHKGFAAPSSFGKVDNFLDDLVIGLLQKKPEDRISDAYIVADACKEMSHNFHQPVSKKSFFGRLFGDA
ncbi:MAG: serine/threonine protein kinase [Planctomycetota bacterium]